MPDTWKIKNKLNVPLRLEDGAGDSVQIPPYSTCEVDARFIAFQLPALAAAEVIDFDYAAHLAAKPKTPAPAPVQTEQKSSGNGQ